MVRRQEDHMKKLFLFVLLATICACGAGGGGGGGLVSISISPENSNIGVGVTQQFTATGTYSDGSTEDLTASCMWLSSTIGVATIDDESGLATGVATGTSTITASSSAVTGSTTLTVGTAASGKIAFVSSRDGVNEIYVMNADGSGQTRVTANSGTLWTDQAYDPRWSPDGSKILFSSYDAGSSLELYVVNVDGTGETQLTFPTWAADWNSQAAWSPNGTEIAFISYQTGHTQVYTMSSTGGPNTLISDVTTPAGHATFTNPNWSPSGGTITADTHWWSSGPPEDGGGIYAFPPTSGVQLTHSSGDYNSTWSPNGDKIAFYRNNSGTNPTGSDIYVMNIDGSGATELAEGLNPVWSPDGTKIAYLKNFNDTGYMLFVINADGTNEINLMSTFDNIGVTWLPSWSPDSTMLPFESDGDIYLINADGTGLAKITDDNQSGVGPQWAPQ